MSINTKLVSRNILMELCEAPHASTVADEAQNRPPFKFTTITKQSF
jgi:hypothetical protein